MRRLPLLPMLFLAIFVITGLGAPWIAPHNPERGEIRSRNVPPAWLEGGTSEYLLGTDHLGRDLLSRVIFGARISLAVVAVTLGVGMVIGVASGLIAGWYGGWLDELLMRIVDIKLAIPTILLALVLVLALGQSFLIIIAILAIAVWPASPATCAARSSSSKLWTSWLWPKWPALPPLASSSSTSSPG